jgi:hypothetical protein
MAHHNTIKQNSYNKLARRINMFPQGAPPTQLLFEILKMLFSEREADLVSSLPIKPFNIRLAARTWKTGEKEASVILNDLADRGLLIDYEEEGELRFTMPPPMAGFFEFSMMRYRNDLDQKVLAELYYQYMNVEEDFIKSLFTDGTTQLGRVFVNEEVLSSENALHVLDYERASEVVKTASAIGIGVCYRCPDGYLHDVQ